MAVFEVVCAGCGEAFEAGSSRAKWCSARCRKRAQRSSDVVEPAVESKSVDPRDDDGGLVAAVRAELERAGQLDTVPGQQALVLARAMTKVDASGLSGLSKELSRVKAEALGESSPSPGPGVATGDDDEDDEVKAARRRREEKAAAAAGQ